MRKIFLPLLLLYTETAHAQTDSIKSPLTFSGYAEVYYCYDFNNPSDHALPYFINNFSRANEVNLNLGYLQANYSKGNIRAAFGLMAGTYPQYALAGEQPLLKNVWQANVGVKLYKKKNFWLDAGILPSHIGFENPAGITYPTLTRSILADNTPYYESGVRISYTTDSDKWYVSVLILNGWQNIARINGNNTPAVGTQITYIPTNRIIINYSTFIGNVKPDSDSQLRFYNNFYATLQLSKKTVLTLGFDYCIEQKADSNGSGYNMLYTPVLILKYQLTKKFDLAARVEYYCDPNGIIIPTNTPNGFQTAGYSINIGYAPANNVLIRLEGKTLNSMDKIFTKDGEAVNTDTFLTVSMAISF